jgi:hypothetical protein
MWVRGNSAGADLLPRLQALRQPLCLFHRLPQRLLLLPALCRSLRRDKKRQNRTWGKVTEAQRREGAANLAQHLALCSFDLLLLADLTLQRRGGRNEESERRNGSANAIDGNFQLLNESEVFLMCSFVVVRFDPVKLLRD